uniref:Putative lipocalin-3 1 n=1 Tax=Rhipicephalus microplus TaxID=6941 RepID=A0A6M2D8A9_RHIMP
MAKCISGIVYSRCPSVVAVGVAMHSWLLFFTLHLAISEPILETSQEYDDYECEDDETTPTNNVTRKPLKPKPNPQEFPHIFDFYNTTEKIWVYNTTKKSNETCMVDTVEDISYINVLLTRYFYVNETIQNLTFEATFSINPIISPESKTYNEMRVSIPGDTHFETLVHFNKTSHCGIFYNNYHGNTPEKHEKRLENIASDSEKTNALMLLL